MKNRVTPPGFDPETVRLVAQRLNHYATPGPIFIYIIPNSRKTSKINYDKGFLALLIGLDQHFKGFNWTFSTKLQQLLSR